MRIVTQVILFAVCAIIGAAAVDVAEWGTWEAAVFALLLWVAINQADTTARKAGAQNAHN